MEIIIDENHVGSLLAHIGAVLSHCDTDVSPLQSDTVIDTVSSHANNVSSVLERLYDRQLVLWGHAIKYADIVDDFFQLRLVELVDVVTRYRLLVDRVQAD